jgi:cytosine deaminase
LYRIPKVIIGENQTFTGAEQLLIQNGVEIIVVNDDECIAMMKNFIKTNPELWNEDIGV